MGFKPHWIIGAKVVENVQAGVITSESLSKFREFNPNRIADDPLLTNNPYFLLN